MSEIYKVNRVINNEISQIYVFVGHQDKTVEEIKGDGSTFSATELRNIDKNNIEVYIVQEYIHGDDTIQRIKEKIFKECKYIDNAIPNMMYLFSITENKLNNDKVFNDLTQEDTIDLTDNRLKQFLSNITVNKNTIKNKTISTFFKGVAEEDKYEYNDFNKLNIDWNNNLNYTQCIGQKLIVKKNYPFIANPYNNKILDDFLKRTSDNLITTQNAYLLFKYFPLKDNNIYLSLVDDVLKYTEIEGLDQSYFLKLYYPILYKNIKSKTELEEEKLRLYQVEKTRVNKYYTKINKQVDIFYDIQTQIPEKLDYEKQGISYLYITLHPENPIKLPLEILFKIINSTREIPLIKYNPGVGHENIYRLFTDNNISISGIKIPILFIENNKRKTKIANISRILSRKESIGYYIEYNYKKTVIEIYCEFYENGTIEIRFETIGTLLEKGEAENIIKNAINKKILNTIRNYLKQSGYNYINFDKLDNKNVEIKSMNYEIYLKNDKLINLKKYIGCISTLFNIIEGTVTKTGESIELMYKRVNVFQVMDSIKAFITTMRQKGIEGNDMIIELIDNFPNQIQDEKKALELIAEWQQEVQVMIDKFGEGKKVIESNPGFPTQIFAKSLLEGTFTVLKMESINDIKYLKFIIGYIDSLFKIVLKMGNDALKEEVDKICRKKVKNQDNIDVIKDIQADTEKRGAIKFGERKETILDIDEDSDEDELDDIEEDTDEEEEEEEEDEFGEELGDDMFGDDEIEFGDEALDELTIGEDSKTKKSPSKKESHSKEKTPESINSDLSLIDDEDSLSSIEDGIESMEDTSLGGGAKEEGKIKKDLTGLAITGAKSVFTKRLRDHDQKLFQKKDTPGYKSFTKGCPNQYRRQPISITDEEKEYIDIRDAENGTSSYGEFIRYGSDESKDNKKYNYICPRFWCLNDNQGRQRSLTLEQINNGECGGWKALINEKAKKVPRNGRIVEFTDERFHREQSGVSSLTGDKKDLVKKLLYRPMYPGFQGPEKHKDGLCIPCCFQTPFKNQEKIPEIFKTKKVKREKENKKADNFNLFGWKENEKLPFMFKKIGSEFPYHKDLLIKDTEGNTKIDMEKLKSPEFTEFRDTYLQVKDTTSNINCLEHRKGKIKSKTKKTKILKSFNKTPIMSFPLQKNQFGYMNMKLQKFLGFNNNICYSTKGGQDKRLKTQTYCILRLGVKKNKQQSFLELLASVYNYYEKMVKLPSGLQDITIKELKKICMDNLTVDKFVIAQNGILPTLFSNDELEIDLNNYNKSEYLSKIQNVEYKTKIVRAFENFKNYINNETEIIDYRYIWDLITKPLRAGGILFDKGFNLLIFKDPEDDVQEIQKIEIICPTNHYSNEFYNNKKKTLMVFQKGDYFEPLCKVHKRGTTGSRESSDFEVKKFFRQADFEQFKDKSSLFVIISNIKEILNKSCIAKKSLKKYDYERNIPVKKLTIKLEKMGYVVSKQVVNNNNKVIGVIASLNQKTANFIPCRPSSLLLDKEFTFSTDIPINEYKESKIFLQTLYNKSNKNIPCNIREKIISDNKIVGIKTITNQVIPVIPVPKSEFNDDIEELDTYSGENEMETDQYVLSTKVIDEDREIIIKSLNLENNFYNLFRNTLKIILSNNKNTNKKQELVDIVENISITYIEKLEIIVNVLHELLDNVISFADFQLDTIEDYDNMITCLGLDEQDCKSKRYCSFLRKHNCLLTLPKKNLYSEINNSKLYFNKLADEIIRYSKIRKYLFTPREFLSFDHVNYKVNDNEIILLEEILMDTYFDNIKLITESKYIKTTKLYDIINPKNGIRYSTNANDIIKETKQEKDVSMIDCLMKGIYSQTFINSLSNNESNFIIEKYKSKSICGFELVRKVIRDYTNKDIDTNKIKQKLIELYLKLEMPSTDLIIEKKTVENWTVFSYINWLNNKKVGEAVVKTPQSEKKEEIIKQIQKEDEKESSIYPLTEIEMFMLLQEYKIPVIIKMKGLEKSLIDANVNTFNTFEGIPENVYIIISQKVPTEKSKRFFGLVKLYDQYKISTDIINRELLDGVKNMNELIINSLTFQKEKIEKKKQQDKTAHNKRKEDANWRPKKQKRINKNKVKKLGKKKLSTE